MRIIKVLKTVGWTIVGLTPIWICLACVALINLIWSAMGL